MYKMKSYNITSSDLSVFKKMHRNIIDLASTINKINNDLRDHAYKYVKTLGANKEVTIYSKTYLTALIKSVVEFHDSYSGENIELKEISDTTFHFENTYTSETFEVSSDEILLWSDNLENIERYESKLLELIEMYKEKVRKENEREIKRKQEQLSKKNNEMAALKLQMDRLNSEISQLNT